MDGWFKAVDDHSGHLLWQFKVGSGVIGQPVSYKGPDGKQYVAVLSGVGGWSGGIVAGGLNAVDGTAAFGICKRHVRSRQIHDQGRNALCFCAALAFLLSAHCRL